MHKGRLWELSGRARNWARPQDYPQWPARFYDIHVETWSINTIGATQPMDFFDCGTGFVNAPLGRILWFKNFTVGAHACRIALMAEIRADLLSSRLYGYLLVDGVQQVNFAAGTWLAADHWEGGGNTPFGLPVAGAVLFPAATGLTCTPVGY